MAYLEFKSGDKILSPREATLTISGKRDASNIKANFDGALDIADWQQTITALYFGSDFHEWHCIGFAEDITEGRLTTQVELRSGPWRLTPGIRARNNITLRTYLLGNFGGDSGQFGNLLNALIRVRESTAVRGEIDIDYTTQLGYWNWLLNDRDFSRSETAAGRPPTELQEELAATVLPQLTYDDAVDALFTKFYLMVVINLDYARGGNLLSMHCVLDAIDEDDTDIVDITATAKSYNRRRNPAVRHNELVYVAYGDIEARKPGADSITLPLVRNAAGSPYFGYMPVKAPGPPAETDAEFKQRISDTLYFDPMLHRDFGHAQVAAELQQLGLYAPGNRRATAEVVLPPTAAELDKLRPGGKVCYTIGDTTRYYYITECNLQTPQGVLRLDLFAPYTRVGQPQEVV